MEGIEYDLAEETYYSDEDSCEDLISDYSDSDFDEFNENNVYLPIRPLPITRWAIIEIGTIKLDVSNMGRIKLHSSLYESTVGIHHQGTPYRTYQVSFPDGSFKNYYVHEIVWQAFNGRPPNGWIIQHKPEYTQRRSRRIYGNRLAYITIVPDVVSPLKL